jgi:RNA polymerase sigma-70 factor (ECF subfamily)
MSEEQAGLISACIQGDDTAIAQFIQEYQQGVFRLAISILGDPDEANEATQDTFIAALRALKSYREASTFKAWLYTIALNITRSHLRKRKALKRLQNSLTSFFRMQLKQSQSLEEITIKNERDAEVWKALEKLGEKHRLPIVLRYYHDLSSSEIAEILKINEGTVYSRLSIARERLRAELDGHLPSTGE